MYFIMIIFGTPQIYLKPIQVCKCHSLKNVQAK
jgi:hypothetical protein